MKQTRKNRAGSDSGDSNTWACRSRVLMMVVSINVRCGQSKNFGGEQAARTAAAADRTGHALLHTLYQQNLKNHTTIFSQRYVLDLVKNQDGAVVGCTALCIETGEVVYFKARATVLATGGQAH